MEKNESMYYQSMEMIDPGKAKEYLAYSHGNRHISRDHVSALAHAMKAGNWKNTPFGIVFDCNGVLIDGHHRLMAVILAKATVPFNVTRNADPDCIHVIDTGRPRGVADVVSIINHDIRSPRQIACIARIILGNPFMPGYFERMHTTPKEDIIRVSLANHARITEAADLIGNYPSIRSIAAYCAYCFADVGHQKEKIKEFFSLIEHGNGLEIDNPILAYRNCLIWNDFRTERAKLYLINLTVKTWNEWIAGKKRRLLRVKPVEYAEYINLPKAEA